MKTDIKVTNKIESKEKHGAIFEPAQMLKMFKAYNSYRNPSDDR